MGPRDLLSEWVAAQGAPAGVEWFEQQCAALADTYTERRLHIPFGMIRGAWVKRICCSTNPICSRRKPRAAVESLWMERCGRGARVATPAYYGRQ